MNLEKLSYAAGAYSFNLLPHAVREKDAFHDLEDPVSKVDR
jgi:hypothetical protein